MTKSSHGFQKFDRNEGHKVHIILSPCRFCLADCIIIYTDYQELPKLVGGHCSVTAFHGESNGLRKFLSNSCEVMTLESVVLKEHFSELIGATCVVFPNFQEVLGSIVKTWPIFLTLDGQAFKNITSLPQM